MKENPNHPTYRRGVPVSRAALRRVDELARGLEEASTSGDGGIMGNVGGIPEVGFNTSPGFKGLWVRLTGQASSTQALYSFVALLTNTTSNTWIDDPNYLVYPSGTYPAREVNGNLNVPTGAAGIGAVVWIVPSSTEDTWEFSYDANALPGNDTAFLAITSATPSTVSLQGGGSVTAYPATLLTGGSFAAGSACWYVGPQGELPPLELGLFVRQIGTEASSGKGVYSTQDLTAVVSTTSQTQQTINLVGGGTLTVYPATENVLVAGVWTTVVAGWIYPLSTQQPVAGDKYIGEAIATDGGKIVWAVRVPPANKTVQITGTASGSCSYTWQEVCWDGTAFVPLAGGTTGTATELNCNGKVPVGAIVVLMFIADCSGQTGGGPITIITVFNYCCTTALSSGQGAGGGVAGCLACGNIPMPSTLHVTIPNLGGTCACLAGTYALTYGANVGNAAGASCAAGWIGTFTICSQTVTFFMPCSPTCQGTARLTAYSGTGVVPANQQWSFSPTTYSCGPPFSWSLTATAFTAITFPCAANFGATITP